MIDSTSSLTADLNKAGVSVSNDNEYDNIIFTYKDNSYLMASHIWNRHGGMCMTHGFVRKEKTGSVVVKWIPITNEMYYIVIKAIILKHFSIKP